MGATSSPSRAGRPLRRAFRRAISAQRARCLQPVGGPGQGPWLSCFPPRLVALLCPSLRSPPAPSVSVAPFLPVLPAVQPPGGPLPHAEFPRCCPRPGGPGRAGGTAVASAGFLVTAGSGSWGGHHSNNRCLSAPSGADQASYPQGPVWGGQWWNAYVVQGRRGQAQLSPRGAQRAWTGGAQQLGGLGRAAGGNPGNDGHGRCWSPFGPASLGLSTVPGAKQDGLPVQPPPLRVCGRVSSGRGCQCSGLALPPQTLGRPQARSRCLQSWWQPQELNAWQPTCRWTVTVPVAAEPDVPTGFDGTRSLVMWH